MEAFSRKEALAAADPFLSFERPMPPRPLKGQRQPPCHRGEKEINGGCWVGPIEGERPADTLFDHEGRYYAPSASEEP